LQKYSHMLVLLQAWQKKLEGTEDRLIKWERDLKNGQDDLDDSKRALSKKSAAFERDEAERNTALRIAEEAAAKLKEQLAERERQLGAAEADTAEAQGDLSARLDKVRCPPMGCHARNSVDCVALAALKLHVQACALCRAPSRALAIRCCCFVTSEL
jgi:hypothetical protein